MRNFELSTHVKVISRSSGHTATAAAAYRSGDRIRCDRSERTHDYRRRNGVVLSDIILPNGNPSLSRSQLWNAAEAKENRKNSRTARELMFSLPVELSPEGRESVVRRMADHLASNHGLAVDIAIHAPPVDGDARNHHAHLLMTTRRMVGGVLKEKSRELDDKATGPEIVKDWRRIIADLLNAQIAKEQEAKPVHVEHRSFAERGIDRQPSKHHGKHRYRPVDWILRQFRKVANWRTKGAYFSLQKHSP